MKGQRARGAHDIVDGGLRPLEDLPAERGLAGLTEEPARGGGQRVVEQLGSGPCRRAIGGGWPRPAAWTKAA